MNKKMKYRFHMLSSLYPFAFKIKKFFILNFLLSFAVMILTFVNPIFYQLFINNVIMGKQLNVIVIVVVGYLSVYFITLLFVLIKNYCNNRVVNRITFRVKYRLWNGLFKIPFSDYEKMSIGNTKMYLDDDITQIENFAEQQTIEYFISCFTVIASTVCLFTLDFRLALFSVIVIPLTVWGDHMISKREKVQNELMRQNDQEFSSWLHTIAQGWREIKALNLQHAQKKRLYYYLHRGALYYAKWVNYWVARVFSIPQIKDEFLMQFGLYFLGGILIINNEMKVGNLLVFSMYFGILSKALKKVSALDADLQANMPYSDRLIEELKKTQVFVKKKNGIIPVEEASFIIENVSFSYVGSNIEILQDLNFSINKGERVAIVGKSGCGKTTLLKILTGLVEPTYGNVYFGGVNLRDIDMLAFHKHIGFIMQENMLFNTTIRQNLLYAKGDAQEEELIEVCKKAYIYDFIKSMPEELDTIIGERGVKLSGGQKQRIVLARLFLRDVDVFIFDEATSALDQYSENIVQDTIRNIGKDKTIIVVAHRASSIALCERKIMLNSVGG